MSAYRIMTFDGGGVRGALTAKLLDRLVKKHPALLEKADLYAGTSTGSIIASALAYGLTTEQLVEQYSQTNSEYIFTPSYPELFRPKYTNTRLRKKLAEVFPAELRLRDLTRRVLIPAFQVSAQESGHWGPIFFHNYPGSSTAETTVIDAILASSAAPVYFPSHQKMIDGGVFASNPSTTAIALALAKQGAGRDISELRLLSLGTGFSPTKITANTAGWGALEWTVYPDPPFPLISILLDGVAQVQVVCSQQFLQSHYHRLNPLLGKPISMDEYEKVPELVKIAEEHDLAPTSAWLEEYWVKP